MKLEHYEIGDFYFAGESSDSPLLPIILEHSTTYYLSSSFWATQATLTAINSYAKNNTLGNCLDIGQGDGCLSILAKKLGAKNVYGFDILPEAKTCMLQNAKANDVEINYLDDHVLPDGITIDSVFVNINLGMHKLALPFKKHFTKDTVIFYGGIYKTKVEPDSEIEETYNIIEKYNVKEWLCYILKIK